MDINQIIKNGEDSFNEFKEKVSDFKVLRDEMIAFANLKGGNIFIGINDDREVVGLDDVTLKKYIQEIDNIISNQINPSLDVLTHNVDIDNKIIIHIEILNTNQPHRSNKGVYWIRKGSSKQIMNNQELARLFSKGKLIHIDEEETQAKIGDELNIMSFYLFLDKKYNDLKDDERKNHKKLLINLNLANGEYFNLSGLLFFANNPQKYKPLFYIQCCYFDGYDSSSSIFLDRDNIYGDMKSLYNGAMSFIKRNLRKKQTTTNFNDKAKLEIEEDAIIESVVNAIVHRDYYTNNTIKIFLFKDRLEIISAGGLTNHLNEDKIKSGTSIARNQNIQAIAQIILPYSGLGTGIKRMQKLEPSLELKDDKMLETFTVIFKRENTID